MYYSDCVFSMDTLNLKRRKKCLKIIINKATLAWRLLSNICARIISNIWNSLNSQEFIEKHKVSPQAFIRNRKLPFHHLVLFLLGNLKSSYNKELDRFFKQINADPIGCSEVTKAAVSIARKNLKPDTFLELNDQAVAIFEDGVNLDTWHGFRLMAIDGSTVRLPNIPEICKHFGTRSGGNGVPCPIGRISELYDPLNKLTIRSIFSPIHIEERDHAYQLLLNLMPNDLVILDRGYPSKELFYSIVSMCSNFCARLNGRWKIMKDFLNTDLKEQIITLPLPGSKEPPLSVRLLRIELSSGETEVLLTSLTDLEKYPYELFAGLYHERWFIEEDYKTLKLPLELENFTGKTVHSIYQDVYAQILAKNITSFLSFGARRQMKQAGKIGLYEHQLNFTYALSKSKEIMAFLFHSIRTDLKKLMKILETLFIKITEPVRPNRKYQRKRRIYKRIYHYNRKSIA